ncbi:MULTISPECIES: DUF11 domain-containing protein [Parachlamydia]|uniref:DUF11 domain-containing protein n=1 Tax=Parachlamydia TaxID=83551 RepID=UPI0009B5C149|nr:DUF11 domain-containing protein [Parachlamydia acanthamoebae]
MYISPFSRCRGSFSFKITLFLLILLSVCLTPIEATYIKRYTTTDNGGILFTGNTLGLSKLANKNEPGTCDSAGAFITADTTQKVGNYLPGTTLSWQQNSSSAFLDLPQDSTVLYAELIWSGSYGFQNEITGSEPNTPITLSTPQHIRFQVTPDPTTSQTAITPGYSTSGNYMRSADVTSIVQEGGGGKYTVGGIPATISAHDDTHNAAGWTLAVVFRNGLMLTYNMTLFVGCEQASYTTNLPASISGFCAPPSGALKGNLFISAIEGDANKMGDHMLFGDGLPLTINNNSLEGTNNPAGNFFGSQINTLLPLNKTAISTKLVDNGSGLLDTRGSFGNHNSDPVRGIVSAGNRQGYDITSIDISDIINYNQTSAYALGTTTGDDYTINALGIQIQVGAPIITATMQVNSQNSIEAVLEETLTFTCKLQNDGTSNAVAVTFKDILESGLEYVPGSFKFNEVLQNDPDLVEGFALGNLLIGQAAMFEFKVLVTDYPSFGNIFYNQGILDYQSQTCLNATLDLEAITNMVSIILPSQDIPNLTVFKLVNSEESIDASVGEVVTFTLNIDSCGLGTALNVVLKDPLPQGHTLISNSVVVDDVLVDSDPDLHNGILIGNISSGNTSKVIFKASINDYPPENNAYSYTANADFQYLPFPSEPVGLSTTSNTVRTNFSLPPPPPPPPPFTPVVPETPPPNSATGVIKKCESINRKDYCCKVQWEAANSQNVLFYRIYHKSKIVAKVDVHSPLIYRTCLRSKKSIQAFEITAVYPNNAESLRVKVRMGNE